MPWKAAWELVYGKYSHDRGLQPSHTRRPLKQRTNESGKHRTLDSICCNTPIQPTTDGPTLGSYARSLTVVTQTCGQRYQPTEAPSSRRQQSPNPCQALIHTQHGQPCENMIWNALVHGSRVCCTCTPMDTGLIPYPRSRPLLPPPRLAACKLPVDCTHTRRREEARQAGRC